MTSKKAVSNYLLSSSKRLQLLILFFHSKTNLKVLLTQLRIGPRPHGLGTPQP